MRKYETRMTYKPKGSLNHITCHVVSIHYINIINFLAYNKPSVDDKS
jgi:hypothetical protein